MFNWSFRVSGVRRIINIRVHSALSHQKWHNHCWELVTEIFLCVPGHICHLLSRVTRLTAAGGGGGGRGFPALGQVSSWSDPQSWPARLSETRTVISYDIWWSYLEMWWLNAFKFHFHIVYKIIHIRQKNKHMWPGQYDTTHTNLNNLDFLYCLSICTMNLLTITWHNPS